MPWPKTFEQIKFSHFPILSPYFPHFFQYDSTDLNIKKPFQYPENIEKDAVFRGGKLYDKKAHSYKWTAETVYVDILWYFSWENIPAPIQAYIVARAAAIVSSRIIGDSNQYQMLQQKEGITRAQAMEYECSQGDYSFFGSPDVGNFYRPYKPFHTLQR